MKTRLCYTICFLFLFSFLGSVSVRSQSKEQLTNLPTFYITTDDGLPITSKTTYKTGDLLVVSSDPSEELSIGINIRGRGNSTWGHSKKPYRMKLDKKTQLLNLPAKEKDWVLLANALDNSLIRNALAFKIGEILEMETNPSVRFVDIYLNNSYVGNYMVTDQVEVGSANRVPVEKQENYYETGLMVTGGYLLEIDGFRDGNLLRNTKVPIVVKYPKEDEINTAQYNYIQNFITDFELRLFGTNFKHNTLGYRAKVDTASLVNWYIACELTANRDAFWQTYIYKKRGIDKLFFGPLWDYDRVAFLSSDVTKWMRESAYEPRQWVEQFWRDEWFQEAVWKRWRELLGKDIYQELAAYLDDLEVLLEESFQENNERWSLSHDLGYNVAALKSFLKARIDFMTTGLYMPGAFVPEEKYYNISNVKTGTYLTAEESASGFDNDSTVLWALLSDQENEKQQWYFAPVSDGYYQIVNRSTGRAICSNGRGVAGHGKKLKLADVNNKDDYQLWKIAEIEISSVFGLENKGSGYVMANLGGLPDNGARVVEWSNDIYNNVNQQWSLKATKLPPTTGLCSDLELNDFSVYPNPAQNYAFAQIYLQTPSDVVLSIVDMSGKLLHKASYYSIYGDQTLDLPVSELRSGVYFVVVNVAGAKPITQKLIVY